VWCDSVEVLAQQASVLAVQGVEQFKLGKDGCMHGIKPFTRAGPSAIRPMTAASPKPWLRKMASTSSTLA
jgi:hypothetical protein